VIYLEDLASVNADILMEERGMTMDPRVTARAERIDYETIVNAVDAAGDRFVALLRSLSPEDGAKKVPDMTWTVSETAAHMLNIVNRGLGDRRRADSVAGLAVLNDKCVAEVDTRAPTEIAERIETDKTTLLGLLRGQSAERAQSVAFPLHAGVRTDIPSALSYMLFDFVGHGLDIARATGREWSVDASDAALILHASLPLLGPWATEAVMSGTPQRAALTFPGDADAIVLEVGGGSYAAQNHERAEVSYAVEVDAVEAFLAIAGRAEASSSAAARLASWFIPI